MRGFFIITKTNEMHKHVESFTCLNSNESQQFMFDHRMGPGPSAESLDAAIGRAARDYKPDVIVYVGACSGRMPTPGCFREMKRIAPTVCFVSDAADQPWWPKVEEYDREKSFSAIVALDGAPEWPKADNHITALTPIDPKYYPDPIRPHKDRDTFFGFAGNPGATNRLRYGLVGPMKGLGLAVRERSQSHGNMVADVETYTEAANHMANTRVMPNFSWTGSFLRHHVKGRVVEAGWAGCCLLELKKSPARNFFEPGVDYLEYDSVDEVKGHLARLKDPGESQAFGERLRKKVEENHSPAKFWGRILERL